MRLPSKPDALESTEKKPDEAAETPVAVTRDPSYPDRARIDSDVRAFLRPVSSPWIVFDRDSRVDDFAKSALRIGAVFASSPSFRDESTTNTPALRSTSPLLTPEPMAAPVISAKDDPIREGVVLSSGMSSSSCGSQAAPMFPPSSGTSDPVSEPSNLVVASDVIGDSCSHMPSSLETDDANGNANARVMTESDPFAGQPTMFARKARMMAVMGACAGVLALVGLTSVALSRSHVKTAAATTQTMQAAQPPQQEQTPPPAAPVEPATIELDTQQPTAPATTPTTTSAEQHAGPVEPITKMPLDPKKRFGKLTIKEEAKGKTVWFDGKRMLGSGQRSFMVFCGMHTVAVNSKTETKDIEIPCNGEYAVAK